MHRSNNTLEIWDVKHTPHIDRVLIVDENDSIESIAWCDERLFTAGQGCSVLEHDILNMSVKVSVIYVACKSNILYYLDFAGSVNE